jgi:hypothetical protein
LEIHANGRTDVSGQCGARKVVDEADLLNRAASDGNQFHRPGAIPQKKRSTGKEIEGNLPTSNALAIGAAGNCCSLKIF